MNVPKDTYLTVHFQWVNRMVCELHLRKTVKTLFSKNTWCHRSSILGQSCSQSLIPEPFRVAMERLATPKELSRVPEQEACFPNQFLFRQKTNNNTK